MYVYYCFDGDECHSTNEGFPLLIDAFGAIYHLLLPIVEVLNVAKFNITGTIQSSVLTEDAFV